MLLKKEPLIGGVPIPDIVVYIPNDPTFEALFFCCIAEELNGIEWKKWFFKY